MFQHLHSSVRLWLAVWLSRVIFHSFRDLLGVLASMTDYEYIQIRAFVFYTNSARTQQFRITLPADHQKLSR
jgi:hypothetical protein